MTLRIEFRQTGFGPLLLTGCRSGRRYAYTVSTYCPFQRQNQVDVIFERADQFQAQESGAVCGLCCAGNHARMQAAEAAEAREELAWSSYTALSALAFISREDLVRELVVIAGHPVAGDADAPIISESMVREFLHLQGVGIPEAFDDFVELHNRLIDWAIARCGSTGGASLRISSPSRRSNYSPSGRSISRAASHRAMESSPLSFRSRSPSEGLTLINPTEDAPGLIPPPHPPHGGRRWPTPTPIPTP